VALERSGTDVQQRKEEKRTEKGSRKEDLTVMIEVSGSVVYQLSEHAIGDMEMEGMKESGTGDRSLPPPESVTVTDEPSSAPKPLEIDQHLLEPETTTPSAPTVDSNAEKLKEASSSLVDSDARIMDTNESSPATVTVFTESGQSVAESVPVTDVGPT
ncbi:hypothetical protein HK097_005707, partial [Rhizophlyctis rosea]